MRDRYSALSKNEQLELGDLGPEAIKVCDQARKVFDLKDFSHLAQKTRIHKTISNHCFLGSALCAGGMLLGLYLLCKHFKEFVQVEKPHPGLPEVLCIEGIGAVLTAVGTVSLVSGGVGSYRDWQKDAQKLTEREAAIEVADLTKSSLIDSLKELAAHTETHKVRLSTGLVGKKLESGEEYTDFRKEAETLREVGQLGPLAQSIVELASDLETFTKD